MYPFGCGHASLYPSRVNFVYMNANLKIDSKSLLSDVCKQGVDIGFGGCPVGDKAYGSMTVASRPPELERCNGAQRVDFLVWENEKLLVCG